MIILKIITLFLPWFIKKIILKNIFGYHISKKTYVGFSWFYPKKLVMEEGATISHLNFCHRIESVSLGINTSIGRSNWITGFPLEDKSHFSNEVDRIPSLIIGNESAITNKHHIDCTSKIVIGDFVTVAGYASQFLTHSININNCRQESSPIEIGSYCFIGTNSTILGRSTLPDYSVLGAKSLLNKDYYLTNTLYAGVPARAIKELDSDNKYFSRKTGFVN